MDVNECFKNVCRVLFKDDIGDFNGYEDFLGRYVDPIKQTNSTTSGKPVCYSEPYCNGAKFLSLDETRGLEIEPLKPYEMKDIDGLLNAVRERFYYAGNKILGNSQDINGGENCVDCFHAHNSHELFGCEYMIGSQMILDSKFMIGCSWGSESSFGMNSTELFRVNRCFEAAFTVNSNDGYFVYNCKNCNDVMFCLNQFSKRHCIGNMQLPKDKYLELKEKLISEISDELKANKTFPSLVEIASGELIG